MALSQNGYIPSPSLSLTADVPDVSSDPLQEHTGQTTGLQTHQKLEGECKRSSHSAQTHQYLSQSRSVEMRTVVLLAGTFIAAVGGYSFTRVSVTPTHGGCTRPKMHKRSRNSPSKSRTSSSQDSCCTGRPAVTSLNSSRGRCFFSPKEPGSACS